MAKVLKTAATVVGAVAAVVATAGVLAPTATAAALGSIGLTAGTVAGTAALTTALTLGAAGLSLVAGLTAKKPTSPTNGSPERFAVDPGGLWWTMEACT